MILYVFYQRLSLMDLFLSELIFLYMNHVLRSVGGTVDKVKGVFGSQIFCVRTKVIFQWVQISCLCAF